ncbi:MAG: alpha/beta hydrolase [Chitinophagaceae bacterium]|nr:MAG: alpha/beta hydrolase [Chitinophagaceae bacterium]
MPRQVPVMPRWALAAAATIAVLGASAYVVNRKSRQAEADNPPKGRFVDVDGVHLHLTEHGDPQAPALVMLHGMGTMGTEMELSGLVELAQSQYRVLVFDRPGYGHSDRPSGQIYTPELQAGLLLKALDQLGIERPVVLAHSWATLVATAMALQAPEAIKGLVLVGGYHTPGPRFDVLFNGMPAIPLIGPLMARTLSPLLSRAMWPAMSWRIFSPAPKAIRKSFSERYPLWMSLRPKSIRAAAAEAAMLVPETLRLFGRQPELQLPVVIVAGAQDRLLAPGWHSRRLQGRLPNSRLHVVPKAGHMVHHAAPDLVFEAVREVSSMVTQSTPVDWSSPPRLSPEEAALHHQVAAL